MNSYLSTNTKATDDNQKYRYNVFHNKSFTNEDKSIEYANFANIFDYCKENRDGSFDVKSATIGKRASAKEHLQI